MKTNDIGKVELFEFEITNLVTSMDTNIEMLMKHVDAYPIIKHIVGYVKYDMDTFKKHCGLPVNLTDPATQSQIEKESYGKV